MGPRVAMNIRTLKGLSWIAALGVGGYLGWDVYDFLQRRAVLEQPLSDEEQLRYLSNEAVGKAPRPASNFLAYDDVKRAFLDMNWTGAEPPAPAPTRPPDEAATRTAKPVSELLKVLLTQVDSEVAGSLAFVKFLDPKLNIAATNEDHTLRVGERLADPHGDVRVDAITVEGVRFAFDEEGREPELVPTESFPGGSLIVRVDANGVLLPDKRIVIPRSEARWNPTEMTIIGKNKYRIGTEDVRSMEQDYSRILSQDIRTSPHRDPRTGQVDGLEVTHVAPNSIAQRAGLEEGEILKSINGHRVTSPNEAIAYVKKEAETTTTWVALFERQGKEYTRTYYSPEN